MVARPDVFADSGLGAAQGRARQDVVDPPPDVPLAGLPPVRPPREHSIILWIQCASDVDQPTRFDCRPEEAPLVLSLTDGVGLALAGVDVPVVESDVHVAAEDKLGTFAMRFM